MYTRFLSSAVRAVGPLSKRSGSDGFVPSGVGDPEKVQKGHVNNTRYGTRGHTVIFNAHYV